MTETPPEPAAPDRLDRLEAKVDKLAELITGFATPGGKDDAVTDPAAPPGRPASVEEQVRAELARARDAEAAERTAAERAEAEKTERESTAARLAKLEERPPAPPPRWAPARWATKGWGS